MSNANIFKAPQKPLRTSWKEISFKKASKKVNVVSKSYLGVGAKVVKNWGTYVQGGNQKTSNQY